MDTRVYLAGARTQIISGCGKVTERARIVTARFTASIMSSIMAQKTLKFWWGWYDYSYSTLQHTNNLSTKIRRLPEKYGGYPVCLD